MNEVVTLLKVIAALLSTVICMQAVMIGQLNSIERKLRERSKT